MGEDTVRKTAAARPWLTPRGIIAGFAIAAAALSPGYAAGGDQDLLFRTVALTGDAAPGTTDGAHFASFMNPVSPSDMPPRIDANGTVAFTAFIAGGLVDSSNRSGIWSEAGGALDLVVRTGMPAPGVGPGVVFSGFPDEYLPPPPGYAAGRVAFNGRLTGPGVDMNGGAGIWSGTAAGLELVVRSGTQVPGLPDGAYFSSVAPFGIDEGGTVHIAALLLGTGVTGASNESLLQFRNGGLTLIMREGDPAPGLPNGIMIGSGGSGIAYIFRGVSFNTQSQLVVSTLLHGSGVNSANDEALYLQDATSGEFVLLLREGDPVPGMASNVTFGGNDNLLNLRPALNSASEVAFTTQIGGAVSTQSAVFRYADGAISVVAMRGEPAPGTDTDFSFMRSPLLSDSGGIAFVGGVFFEPQGIWRSRDGVLTDVVLAGAVVARGSQSVVIEAVNGIAGFNAADDTVATVTVDDGTGLLRSGLLMAAADGELILLAARGDHFDVRGDGSELREVQVLVPGDLNDFGEFSFRLDFTDGSSGHFTAVRDRDGDGVGDGRDNCASTANPDQRDTNNDGFGNVCDPDLDNNGIVNFDDLTLMRAAFFSTDEDADLSGDGVVNFQDLNIMRAMFFGPPGQGQPYE